MIDGLSEQLFPYKILNYKQLPSQTLHDWYKMYWYGVGLPLITIFNGTFFFDNQINGSCFSQKKKKVNGSWFGLTWH